MELRNLCPYKVSILWQEFPRDDCVARVDKTSEMIGMINGIPIIRETFGEVYIILPCRVTAPFPPQKEGVGYIVTPDVLVHLPGRKDVFAPGVLGCREDGGIQTLIAAPEK